MNDTQSKITLKVFEMIQKKTGEERLKMGCSMFDFSKRLVLSSIIQSNPHASQGEIRRQLFLRFYGSDFNPLQHEKIIKRITSNL